MNKLYAFCALVFLNACGSPGFEGNWIADDYPVKIKISGNLLSVTLDGESIAKCLVEEPNESSTRASCNAGDDLSMIIEGDVMVVTNTGTFEQIIFSRN